MIPPNYCQYVPGRCDQDFSQLTPLKGFFIYPSQPAHLAQTINETVKHLQTHSSPSAWQSWETSIKGGNLIFCKICKCIRSAQLVIANITTLNFNVLFELGYTIGLGKAVLPVRDSSYDKDRELFKELGIFDVLKYETFQNSNELGSLVTRKGYAPIFAAQTYIVNKKQPIYYIRSPIENDGSLKLFSALKKSAYRFRTFDCREIPRLSLHEAYRQVHTSVGVVAHLIDPNRDGATVHNARAAFVCGMAMALEKHVLILQEGLTSHPIDYKDVVVHYTDPSTIAADVQKFVRATDQSLARLAPIQTHQARQRLESIDLGDPAAENEVTTLSQYFVTTPQFHQAIQGRARLVVGRKGSGKTAVFYGIRKALNAKNVLVLDLKPEGHQLTTLRDNLFPKLSAGQQEHALTAFWHYLLLLEVANKLIVKDRQSSWETPGGRKKYDALKALYDLHVRDQGGIGNGGQDFSERVMSLVNGVLSTFPKGREVNATDITQAIYKRDIAALSTEILEYLGDRDEVCLLIDNIDKGWPTRGAKFEDVVFVRSLLDAARKVQQAFAAKQVKLYSFERISTTCS